jgi:hypothetical protein
MTKVPLLAAVVCVLMSGGAWASADTGGAGYTGFDRTIGLEGGGPRIGAAVLLGGGVESFSHGSARSVTEVGGFWSLRLAWGMRRMIGVEAAYIGSAQGLNVLGMSNNAWLVSNGAEGVLRLNAPVERGAMLFEPFLLAGLGWKFYEVRRSPVTADIAAGDNVLEVPFGGGFAFGYHAFMVDTRFTYRATFFNDLFRTTGAPLDSWSMGTLVGIQF